MLPSHIPYNTANGGKRFSPPILLAFGAWVQENEIYFTPGKLEGYDAEAYAINKMTIDEIINSALALVKGAVSK